MTFFLCSQNFHEIEYENNDFSFSVHIDVKNKTIKTEKMKEPVDLILFFNTFLYDLNDELNEDNYNEDRLLVDDHGIIRSVLTLRHSFFNLQVLLEAYLKGNNDLKESILNPYDIINSSILNIDHHSKFNFTNNILLLQNNIEKIKPYIEKIKK